MCDAGDARRPVDRLYRKMCGRLVEICAKGDLICRVCEIGAVRRHHHQSIYDKIKTNKDL